MTHVFKQQTIILTHMHRKDIKNINRHQKYLINYELITDDFYITEQSRGTGRDGNPVI